MRAWVAEEVKLGTSAAYVSGEAGRRVSSVVFAFSFGSPPRVGVKGRKQRRLRTICDAFLCEGDGRARMSDSH